MIKSASKHISQVSWISWEMCVADNDNNIDNDDGVDDNDDGVDDNDDEVT